MGLTRSNEVVITRLAPSGLVAARTALSAQVAKAASVSPTSSTSPPTAFQNEVPSAWYDDPSQGVLVRRGRGRQEALDDAVEGRGLPDDIGDALREGQQAAGIGDRLHHVEDLAGTDLVPLGEGVEVRRRGVDQLGEVAVVARPDLRLAGDEDAADDGQGVQAGHHVGDAVGAVELAEPDDRHAVQVAQLGLDLGDVLGHEDVADLDRGLGLVAGGAHLAGDRELLDRVLEHGDLVVEVVGLGRLPALTLAQHRG